MVLQKDFTHHVKYLVLEKEGGGWVGVGVGGRVTYSSIFFRKIYVA